MNIIYLFIYLFIYYLLFIIYYLLLLKGFNYKNKYYS